MTPDGYSEAFGYQWKKFKKTQLDSYSHTKESRKRVEEVCGGDLFGQLNNKLVLEVGCGAGRFTEILLEAGAIVYSVDLSEAVDVNLENFPQTSRHQIFQADVAKLPFLPKAFDVVFCLGVIQHTPSPERTLKFLSNYVKINGWIFIDHYRKSLSWKFRTAPIARTVLKRVSPERAFRITTRLYTLAKPFYEFSTNRYYRKLINVIFPVVYFGDEIPSLPLQLRDDWSQLDTFDSLTDWYKHRRSALEIEKTLMALELSNIKCFNGGNGVVARAQRSN